MAKTAQMPLNLGILNPSRQQLQRLRAVTALDIYDRPGGNFHDDGLFSTTIFGRVGDDLRDQQFGYIPLNIPVLHPTVYQRLIRLKSLYGEILSGKTHAVWDPDQKDFTKADVLTGETGYTFFMSHWHELSPARTGSSTRDLRVDVVEKYRDVSLLENVLVLPAGLRDAEVGTDGRTTMDEVNELYQKLLIVSRNIPPDLPRDVDNLTPYDVTRFSLTQTLVAINQYFEQMITGKKGFIQGRFASRRVFDGTRGVISSLNTSVVDLSQDNRPQFNDTVIGIYQAAKAFQPKTIHYLKTSVAGEVFDTTSNQVELIDPKTYQRKWVEVSSETIDHWTTPEGLEKVIDELEVPDKRARPVMVEGHYMALLYVNDQQQFCVFRGIDELPEDFSDQFVRPMTYIDLVYLAGYRHWNTHHGFVTRYPVENYMSSYPTRVYVKTTDVGEMRYELGADWQPRGDEYRALEFPILPPDTAPLYHDSVSLNPTRLKPLGGD